MSVVAYQDSWAQQVAELTAGLHQLLPDGVAIEHIGSTSVPGLAAKPCIDVTIVVADLATTPVEPLLVGDGFRRRPEPLNNSENLGGQDWPTMAFAPPVGGPSRNHPGPAHRCGHRPRPRQQWQRQDPGLDAVDGLRRTLGSQGVRLMRRSQYPISLRADVVARPTGLGGSPWFDWLVGSGRTVSGEVVRSCVGRSVPWACGRCRTGRCRSGPIVQ